MTTQQQISVANEWDAEKEKRLYRSLDRFWHPVLYTSDLGDDPVQVVLLEK